MKLACAMFLAAVLSGGPVFASTGSGTRMVELPSGEVRSFYRAPDGTERREAVEAFLLDARPVSNADFLAFVLDQPRWRRSQVPSVYADDNYLAGWAGDLEPGPGVDPDAAVTGVSWFAARAYAAWCGKRLPTLAEWEYAAAAPGRDGQAANDVVLDWYARPKSAGGATSARFTNTFGLEAMHGEIWEWIEDFNVGMTRGDSRAPTELDRARFCGAGSLSAADRADYAGFLRQAFRTSLKGRYTGRLLGFRCARDLPRETP